MNHQEEIKISSIKKIRENVKLLPHFINEFLTGIADTTQPRTRLAYTYDFKIFFNFLLTECINIKETSMQEITLETLENVTVENLEEYMEYLSYYHVNQNEKEYKNEALGKSRKLASLRALYEYFYKKQKIKTNPTLLINFPKERRKEITMLDVDEIAEFLDNVENGSTLTNRQKQFHNINIKRDLAIITLFLGTGMRISELIGINITDIDFKNTRIKIVRKGGHEATVYFGEEVLEALEVYHDERKEVEAVEGHEDAFFLSLQRKRINDRSVQLLVKKYAGHLTNIKKISPHKLRSTYGTHLYRETGDLYLVAEVLGHTDVNTTRKYAKMDEERKRIAAKIVKLRKN